MDASFDSEGQSFVLRTTLGGMNADQFDALVGRYALSAVIGMSVGLSVGRLLVNTPVGVVFGVVTAAGFAWIRGWIARLDE
ncbi:MAG: hypothetical protein A07HR60_00457 [uncultured archaeon A07HR60]|jgi:hypothetical protein|nr:MAG: hypothetical protein A07HR60_00457 [uncultured archaeon A07HR60]